MKFEELYNLIKMRKAEMPVDGYTSELFRAGRKKISQKVGEEAVETLIDAVDDKKEETIYEAVDLIYHLIVLLVDMDIDIEDLEKEISNRNEAKA